MTDYKQDVIELQKIVTEIEAKLVAITWDDYANIIKSIKLYTELIIKEFNNCDTVHGHSGHPPCGTDYLYAIHEILHNQDVK